MWAAREMANEVGAGPCLEVPCAALVQRRGERHGSPATFTLRPNG